MDDTALLQQWLDEEQHGITGWDFSHLDGRWDCPDPPWDYRLIVKSYLRDRHRLLDMGTGGGEVLLTLGHPYAHTTVTEAYPPNVALCRKLLSPLGIRVAQTYTGERLDKLPFEDACFDFIINRHESFDLREVDRTLKPGGYFFTQQVGGENSREFQERLNGGLITHNPAHRIEAYARTLEELGFRILMRDEVRYPVKFYDAGALVFYAATCIWEFPGFSVRTHLEKLRGYQREIEQTGFAQGTGHRFLLAARKG